MKAPRHPGRLLPSFARGALLAFALVVPSLGAAEGIVSARYAAPAHSYGHLVLGRDHNWGAVSFVTTQGRALRLLAPEGLVFEDVAPHVADVDGDGFADLLVVESGPGVGARLAIYTLTETGLSLLAATPHIGRSNRWYAQLGAADLDGDGRAEVAFVDRPHLAKVLRVWRYDPATRGFTEVAALEGLSNHRIGEAHISGGIRDCGDGPQIILASADRSAVMAVNLSAGRLVARRIGPASGPESFERALTCE